MTFLKNLNFSLKISLLVITSVLFSTTCMIGLAFWQSSFYNQLAQSKVEKLINLDLANINQGVCNLVQTENEAVQNQVTRHLSVVKHLVNNAGGVHLSNEKISWNAINQFNKKIFKVTLPKMLIGNQWVGIQTSFNEKSNLVDLFTQLTGATTTIFQRMNPQGDMVRIATTVPTLSGHRAINTYIPAINPDGTKNPVISKILKDEVFQGVAFVVNEKYITAYEPLKDLNGNIIGVLYVGVKIKEVENRIRQAIINTKFSKSGYVYVISGKGREKGKYIISKNGERDGENIINQQDKDGEYIIKNIINNAMKLKTNETVFLRYRWQNLGEKKPRWKIAIISYYKPWDWVICTNIYEDEIKRYQSVLSDGRRKMLNTMTLVGIFITLFVGFSTVLISFTIVNPIKSITKAAKKIIKGNFNQHVNIESQDEIGVLANTFNFMTQKINNTLNELEKSEEKYRMIFENSPEGIFRIGVNEQFIDVNPAFSKMFNYNTPLEMIQTITNIAEQVFADSSTYYKLIEMLEEKGNIEGYEILVKSKDNSHFWISIYVQSIKDSNGKIIFYEGVLENITKRKNAEDALRKSESLFRTLTENSNDVIIRFDHNLKHLYVNPVVYNMTGIKPDKFIGKTHHELGFPENLCILWDNTLKKTFETKEINRIKFNLPNDIWVDWLLMPEIDEFGNVISIIASARDISDFVNAQKALRESEEKFRQIADNVNESFSIIDTESKLFLYKNSSLKKIWGIANDKKNLTLNSLLEKIHPDDRKTTDIFFSHKKTFSIEHRILCNNEIRWIRSSGFPVKDELGNIFRMVHIDLDITLYKKASEKARLHQMQLLQADKMASLGVLVSGVAHEINNPNNCIGLNAPLIVDAWQSALPILNGYYKEKGDFILAGMNYSEMKDNIIPLLNGIINGSMRIEKIVKNLKNYSIQEEYEVLNKVNLNEVANSAITLLNSMIKKKTNNFQVSLCAKSIIVNGSFQRLEQVIINLIQNACDSLTDVNKRIIVSSEIFKDRKIAQLIIEDEGMGIDTNNITKIMDPFFTTKRAIGGTGLGLSVSLGIVKDHHGNLEFQSPKSFGTKAILTLPLRS